MKKPKANSEILKKQIELYSNTLWNPNDLKEEQIKTNSWFSMLKHKETLGIVEKNKNTYDYETDELAEVKYKCKKKMILPSLKQKEILLKWMEAYRIMYNETVKLIKTKRYMNSDEIKKDNMLKRNLEHQITKIKKEYETKIIKEKKQIENEIKTCKKNKLNQKIIDLKNNLKCFKELMKKEKEEKIKEIKSRRKTFFIDFQTIRTQFMQPIKRKLLEKNKGIPSHTLDMAINDCCAMFKSAITNLLNGHIKHFRIRYLKQDKKQKIVKFETSAFGKNKKTFCSSIMGDEIKTNDGSDFSTVTNSCTIAYNCLNNRFTMFIPELVNEQQENDDRNESIALDGGVRVFMTGYAKEHILEVEKKLTIKIGNCLKKIDKMNASNKKEYIKRKYEKKKYQKISNLIDDMHWKTIHYLTENYKTILIGNMSTKSIVQSVKLNKKTKRVAMLMKLYVFKERLKYKCWIKNCNFKHINERNTTQMCSICGNIKKDVGSSKIYKCDNCNVIIGRDINASKNIFMLGIRSIQYN
jgi:transposase